MNYIGNYATGLRLNEGIRKEETHNFGSLEWQYETGNLDAPEEMPAGCCHRSEYFQMPAQSAFHRHRL